MRLNKIECRSNASSIKIIDVLVIIETMYATNANINCNRI